MSKTIRDDEFDFKNIAETCNHFAGEAVMLAYSEFGSAKKDDVVWSASKSRPNGFRLSFEKGNKTLTDDKWFVALVEYHNEEFVEKINNLWKRIFAETDPDNKGCVEVTGVGIDGAGNVRQPWMEFCKAK